MDRNCATCDGKVEEERVELLNSAICSCCAKKGIGQNEVRAATFYNGDGTTSIQIMDAKTFEQFDKTVRSRDNAHGCA